MWTTQLRTNKTGNVRMSDWRVFLQPLWQRKSNKYYIFWVCDYSLNYLACYAHAPYCHLWPAPLYNIFPHYLINSAILGKKILNTKCVLIFSATFVRNISHSTKKWAMYDKKICIRFYLKYPSLLSDCNETFIFSTCFRNILKYEISWNTVRWEPSCYMRTDGQTRCSQQSLSAILRTRLKTGKWFQRESERSSLPAADSAS
jgi:hypothetical protein